MCAIRSWLAVVKISWNKLQNNITIKLEVGETGEESQVDKTTSKYKEVLLQ